MAIEPIKGFYVHDEESGTDGVARLDIEAIDGVIAGDIAPAVIDWLDEHPEATTTVQNGAITKAKINTAFLPEIENAYVTPEMFGAVGDGTTDDSNSFKDAIEYCFLNNISVLLLAEKEYVVAPETFNNANVNNFQNFTVKGVNASKSVIKSNGTSYWYNSQGKEKYNRLNFSNLTIQSDGPLFYQYSTGTEKQICFFHCVLIGTDILTTAGTGNADINRFYNCSFRTLTGGAVLKLDNNQSVGNAFFGCAGLLHGPVVSIVKGGATSFYGCTFDLYKETAETSVVYIPAGGSGQGIGNLGVAFYGSRFELQGGATIHNSDGGDKSSITKFDGCNFATNKNPAPYTAIVEGREHLYFNRCSFPSSTTFHAKTATGDPSGSLIKIVDCISNDIIWKNATIDGTAARIIGENNTATVAGGNSRVDSFDFGFKEERVRAKNSASTKTYYIKATSEGWPASGNQKTIDFPTGTIVKKIYIRKPPLSGGAQTDYNIQITSKDGNTVYAETGTAAFNTEQVINTDAPFITVDDAIVIKATGNTTSITSQGYGFIEYL